MDRYINIDVCLYIHACIRSLCPLTGPGSTLGAQILFSKCHSPLKKRKKKKPPRLLREMIDSRAVARKVQDKPENLVLPVSTELLKG